MKNLILGTAFTLSAVAAQAQMPYNVTTLTQAYQPISNGNSVNQNMIWDSGSDYTLPLGFPFSMFGASTSALHFIGANSLLQTASGPQSGLAIFGATLTDRGTGGTSSVSPIRYTTSGAAGSRIFKLEVSNAGFDDELLNYSSLTDSMSFQVWLYEGSNVVEYRFGPSRISHFGDYFGTNILTGMVKNMNLSTFAFDKIYTLHGNPASPGVDSLYGSVLSGKGLTAMPANGTVYRFTPKTNSPTGVKMLTAGTLARVYPTQCSGTLTIDNNSTGTLRYEVISFSGATLLSGSADAGRTALDATSLTPGMYLLRLSNASNEAEVQKFTRL